MSILLPIDSWQLFGSILYSFERRAHTDDHDPYEATDASLVLTLEEISNLAAEGGKPADTLMNVVALDRQAVQNRRVFGLSA